MHMTAGSRLGWPLLAAFLTAATTAWSTTAPPERVFEDVSHQMLSEVREERTLIKQRPQRFYEIVEEILAPHVDFPRISRWVLGKYWRQATPEQRERFTVAFRDMLVRFYGSAVLDEPGELDSILAQGDTLITFQNTNVGPNDMDTVVRSEVHLPRGAVVPVTFRVHRRDGPWKIYDVTVEGISLVTTYRSNFSQTIARDGLEELVDQLEERKRELADAGEGGGTESASHRQ